MRGNRWLACRAKRMLAGKMISALLRAHAVQDDLGGPC